MQLRPLIVVPLLVATACGGSGASSNGGATAPRIPNAVAAALASRADGVAAALDAGNGCAAKAKAARLQVAATRAIDADRIPAALQPQLQTAVTALASRISCTPPAPAPKPKPAPRHQHAPKPPHHEHGHEKHGKHGGHGEGGGGEG